ncbi:phosphonate ABC transporter, permease protein PhnE [Salibacterium salarium]|uniref:Phosphonate ABC transporter, permease protein PhnE n=1 Tax=Salibacterium salarium TaxID=284579 RepID=A0A428MVT7_9BACI|nr:phosphonate ABC transporter, permease protein PhnE [Salibacterium salarium]RSL30260.1 phosphonate ABC transporter, permease protein PhnE [Salibacterium salarium]
MNLDEWKKQKRRTTFFLFITLFLFLVISLAQLGVAPGKLLDSGERIQSMLNSMVPPDVHEPAGVLEAAIESLQIAIMGTFWGVILSLILAVFGAKNLAPHWTISYIVKGFAVLVRAVPALIWALLFIAAVGLGAVPGILALAVNSTGMLIKVYAEAIEEVEKGYIEAITATGASKFQLVMQGILPLITPIFITWSIFRFDINIRYASVLGVVGAGGIGWELVRASQTMAYNEMLGITIVIFAIVLFAEWVTRFCKMDRKKQCTCFSVQFQLRAGIRYVLFFQDLLDLHQVRSG